jgi:hypothetical protein
MNRKTVALTLTMFLPAVLFNTFAGVSLYADSVKTDPRHIFINFGKPGKNASVETVYPIYCGNEDEGAEGYFPMFWEHYNWVKKGNTSIDIPTFMLSALVPYKNLGEWFKGAKRTGQNTGDLYDELYAQHKAVKNELIRLYNEQSEQQRKAKFLNEQLVAQINGINGNGHGLNLNLGTDNEMNIGIDKATANFVDTAKVTVCDLSGKPAEKYLTAFFAVGSIAVVEPASGEIKLWIDYAKTAGTEYIKTAETKIITVKNAAETLNVYGNQGRIAIESPAHIGIGPEGEIYPINKSYFKKQFGLASGEALTIDIGNTVDLKSQQVNKMLKGKKVPGYIKKQPVRAVQITRDVVVNTSWGSLQAKAGDYVLTDGKEAWPVEKNIFAKTYKPAGKQHVPVVKKVSKIYQLAKSTLLQKVRFAKFRKLGKLVSRLFRLTK